MTDDLSKAHLGEVQRWRMHVDLSAMNEALEAHTNPPSWWRHPMLRYRFWKGRKAHAESARRIRNMIQAYKAQAP